MNFPCLILSLIVLGIILLIIFTNKFVCHWINYYWFWLILGTTIFIWHLTHRFIADWERYKFWLNNGLLFKPEENYDQSVVISKAFLLDFSPAVGLLIPLSLIFDPSRRVARFFCPLSLISGITTIFIQMPFDKNFINELNFEFSLKWIFCGSNGNEIYFLLHALNSILPIAIYLNTPKGNLFNYSCGSIAFVLIFYIYVVLVIKLTHCQWNVSGLSMKDWQPQGEYFTTSSMTKLPVYICMVLVYLLSFLTIIGFCFLKNYLSQKPICKYKDEFNHWFAWYKI